ncbi:MAG TPA: hypothetical protein VJ476_10170 [Rhizomicrobium sp.]|nr:hypothetical protein [Rhizomicrobium sp.]
MIDDDGDIEQPSQIWDMGVVGIAAVLTLAGIATCFFTFTVPADKPAARQAQPTEVTIGLGQSSTIHSDKPAGPAH